MTLFNAATFDLNTGRELELADLFKNGSNYLERINKVVAAKVAEDSRMFFGPVEVKDGDRFYIQDGKNLVIAYPPYEVAPYAAGNKALQRFKHNIAAYYFNDAHEL